MKPIDRSKMNPTQLALAGVLISLYQDMKKDGPDAPESKERLEEAALIAAALARWLRRSGHEVAHTDHVIKNRGLPPTDPKFYEQFHLVEELAAMCS